MIVNAIYCVKHANARGSGGMPSQEILKNRCSEFKFEDILGLLPFIIAMHHSHACRVISSDSLSDHSKNLQISI